MHRLLLRTFSVLLLAQIVAITSLAAQLSPLGKGIRTKKVLFINVNVYEAELLVSNPDSFRKAAALSSPLEALSKQDGVEIRIKFLRNVSARKIHDSFIEALNVNHVDISAAQVVELFKRIEQSPSFEEGKRVTIAADFVKGTVTYVNPEGKATENPATKKEILNLFSIWLGVPVDGGMATLKEALVGRKI